MSQKNNCVFTFKGVVNKKKQYKRERIFFTNVHFKNGKLYLFHVPVDKNKRKTGTEIVVIPIYTDYCAISVYYKQGRGLWKHSVRLPEWAITPKVMKHINMKLWLSYFPKELIAIAKQGYKNKCSNIARFLYTLISISKLNKRHWASINNQIDFRGLLTIGKEATYFDAIQYEGKILNKRKINGLFNNTVRYIVSRKYDMFEYYYFLGEPVKTITGIFISKLISKDTTYSEILKSLKCCSVKELCKLHHINMSNKVAHYLLIKHTTNINILRQVAEHPCSKLLNHRFSHDLFKFLLADKLHVCRKGVFITNHLDPWMLEDTYRMADQLDIELPYFNTYQSLQRFHNDLTTTIEKQRNELYQTPFDYGFNIPTNDKFRLLATPEELNKEGKEMHHCIYSYEHNARKKDWIGFAYQGKERASVSYTLVNGQWKLQQAFLACNQSVTEETRNECIAFCNELNDAYSK